jgi:hypothetical protein
VEDFGSGKVSPSVQHGMLTIPRQAARLFRTCRLHSAEQVWHVLRLCFQGTKKGETWSVDGGGHRYQRWWGEEHFGNGWVRRFGNSTTGEHAVCGSFRTPCALLLWWCFQMIPQWRGSTGRGSGLC